LVSSMIHFLTYCFWCCTSDSDVSWSLHDLGRIGLACCFIYTACAAFRLARFNVQIGVVDKRYFIGIASPLAAVTVISVVWVGRDFPFVFDLKDIVIQVINSL